MKNFDELLRIVEAHPLRKIAVAVAQDATVIKAALLARERNIAETVLVGDAALIRQEAEKVDVAFEKLTVIDEVRPLDAVRKAVHLVSSGQAEILMKGYVHTDDFLRGLLDREDGLRTGSIMSHVFVVENPAWDRLVFVSDAAMNIAPDLEQKAAILLNAVFLAKIFGIEDPKVAVLAAVELVNPKMPATMDAAALATMADRRQYVPGALVDGPFALDNAVSLRAAKHKKISGPVAGQADILIVPDIEAGNIFVKSLVYFSQLRVAGLLLGAKAPVVLTSRADSAEVKLLSMAAAVLLVNRERALKLKVGKVHY